MECGCDWLLERLALLSMRLQHRIGDQMVAPTGVLRSATDFRYQATFDERHETCSGSAW